ncbi:MAG: hypothetical protein IT440_08630, partial [Phycisphaeraceae bacterium]|nr:hypothetical protein [Phycisphaeraceae bacterium]
MTRRVVMATTMMMVLSLGTRFLRAENAGITLTTDGKPASTIVVSSTPTQSAVAAAVDLRDHIRKISGAALPIVTDAAKVTGTRILVGDSAATKALGLTNDSFKTQEYLIGIRGSDLVLMGRDADIAYGVKPVGHPQPTEGKFGKALSFDGEHDALRVSPIGLD